MTTGDCAEHFNKALGIEDAYSARFFWGEVEDGRLIARHRVKGNRQRARIRIHPDDLLAYCERFYPTLTEKIRSSLSKNNADAA